MDQNTRRFDDDRDDNTRRLPGTYQLAGGDPTPCDKCGGERFWARAGAYVVILPPEGILGTLGMGGSVAHPLVCANCGWVEFYLENPNRLKGD